MSSQGIVSCEKASNSPGLYHNKGEKPWHPDKVLKLILKPVFGRHKDLATNHLLKEGIQYINKTTMKLQNAFLKLNNFNNDKEH